MTTNQTQQFAADLVTMAAGIRAIALDLNADLATIGAGLNAAREALARVAELHHEQDDHCVTCYANCACPGEHTCEHTMAPWPCLTGRALAGATSDMAVANHG